jgi:hypothetical protein
VLIKPCPPDIIAHELRRLLQSVQVRLKPDAAVDQKPDATVDHR